MKWTVMFVALFLMSFPVLAQSKASAEGVQEKPLHDREFWRAIAKNRYAVPDGQPVFPLLRELSGYLGSRDPELRDVLAYSITTIWIKHQKKISTDELYSLLDDWQANLRTGIGEAGNDGILKRSSSAHEVFTYGEQDRLSALAATIVVRKDFDAPVFHNWLSALDAADQKVWKDIPPHLELLQTFENDTYMLQGLAAHLSVNVSGPAGMEAQKAVLK